MPRITALTLRSSSSGFLALVYCISSLLHANDTVLHFVLFLSYILLINKFVGRGYARAPEHAFGIRFDSRVGNFNFIKADSVTASPSGAVIEWSKDNMPYALGGMITGAPNSVTLESNNDLIVHDVKRTDEGTYVCSLPGTSVQPVVHTVRLKEPANVVSVVGKRPGKARWRVPVTAGPSSAGRLRQADWKPAEGHSPAAQEVLD
ncbi:hypothetical protein EVAR_52466_1 [Eumeta japonica]|uniref:Ig-like domain-containing protein n=1 Tax=Eumeta variegata TaxID=151549 RepID=A0A4C1Z4J8_EUMVA|nr:hypothetical protein EVAR_52466_1 [Eumeta japonica]